MIGFFYCGCGRVQLYDTSFLIEEFRYISTINVIYDILLDIVISGGKV